MKALRFAALALISAIPALASATPQPPRILMQGHSVQGGRERHAASIDAMAEAGVQMVRDELFWHHVEIRPGELAIPPDMRANLEYTRSKGLRTLLILNYANANYDGNKSPHTPEGRAAYARYAEFMARETRGLVDYFEIWNEPNIDGFWSPRANAKDYAELVKVAYPAVRRGNPDALVVAGALSGAKVDFTEAVLKEGAFPFFDAWSVHPYITPQSPDRAKLFDGQLAAIRDTMKPFGEPKPVWVTEFGYPTHDSGVSEEYQGDMLARAYVGSMAHPWQPVFGWYWFGPDGRDPSLNEDRFGLVRNDWSRKPSFHALRTVTGYLGGTEFVREIAGGDAVSALVFRGKENGTHTTALWARGRDARQVRVEGVPRATLVDVGGMGFALEAYQGQLWIDVTRSPVYLSSLEEPRLTVLESPALELKPESRTLTATAPVVAKVLLHGVPGMDAPGALQVPVAPDLRGTPAADRLSVRYAVTPEAPKAERRLAVLPCSGTSRIPFAFLTTTATVAPGASVALVPRLPGSVEFAVRCNPPVAEGVTRVLWNTSPEPAQGHFLVPPSTSDAPTTVSVALPPSHRPDRIQTVNWGVSLPSSEVVQGSQRITFMTSPRMSAPPAIDGNLTDWPKHAPIRLEERDQLSSYWREWDGPADASAAVYTAWDDGFLYIAAEVQDDDLSGPVIDPENYYKNDGLEIYIDSDFEGDREQTWYSEDDNQIGLFVVGDREVAWRFSHGNGLLEGAKVVFNRAPQPGQTLSGKGCRYIVEAAIPVVGAKPHAGKLIGFNVGLSDDDDASTIHPFGPEVQLMWNGAKGGWQNPHKFSQLFLVDTPHGAPSGH